MFQRRVEGAYLAGKRDHIEIFKILRICACELWLECLLEFRVNGEEVSWALED